MPQAGGKLVGDWQVSLRASADEWHGATDVGDPVSTLVQCSLFHASPQMRQNKKLILPPKAQKQREDHQALWLNTGLWGQPSWVCIRFSHLLPARSKCVFLNN